MPRRPDPLSPKLWTVFRNADDFAVVPQMPLLVRLRQMVPDTFFAQDALKPLKSLMDTNFIIGPVCVLAALYLPKVSVILFAVGIASLAFSSLYWFASHWLCKTYLLYRGYEAGQPVEAPDLDTARAAVK